jgi:hypothetical protein
MDERSSLFKKFVTYGCKMFYNIGHRQGSNLTGMIRLYEYYAIGNFLLFELQLFERIDCNLEMKQFSF